MAPRACLPPGTIAIGSGPAFLYFRMLPRQSNPAGAHGHYLGRKESGTISFGGSDIRGMLVYGLALLALAAFVYFVIVKAIVDDGNEQSARAREISERSQRSMHRRVEMEMKRSARMREQQRERASAAAATR